MTDLNRRLVLRSIAAVPAAAVFTWTDAETAEARRGADAARRQAAVQARAYQPRFFTPHEFATVAALGDLIIPADARSGSASDAGVPEFIDFMMVDQPDRQLAMRGGLGWLDHECRERFGQPFVGCADPERRQILDDIAWPGRTRPELGHGARFFSTLRDLTATGFFTSRIGIADLDYRGNQVVAAWDGAPKDALDHLGVNYDKVEHWYTGG
jgi:hypothetical protein